MSDASSAPTLDYTDQPPDSRVEFRRTEAGIVLVDPPVGLWHYTKWALLIVVALGALLGAFVAILWHRLAAPGATFPWGDFWRTVGPRLPMLLAALAVPLVVAVLFGLKRTTFEVTANDLIVRTAMGLSRTRRFRREQIGDVRCWFGFGVRILSMSGRVLVHQPIHRRADAHWIAETLRRALVQ